MNAAPSLFEWQPPPSAYPDDVPAEICLLFERLALDLHERGFKRYSADAILHRIRWEMQVERGNRAFRCNDHWTAPLSRWFLKRNPKAKGFFELRERVED